MEPSEPCAEGTGAHRQPRGSARQPRGELLSPRVSAACPAISSTLRSGFEGGRRPWSPGRGPRSPPLGSPPPPRLLQKGARTHHRAPGKAPGARLQDRAIGGAGRLPSSPGFPTSPPSLLPRSLAPSSLSALPAPLTERLPYKIYESALPARGAERRPTPRAAALQPRAAPPPKVFSPRPPPGTILGPRPSKYLPQSPGRSSGHSRVPPGLHGLPKLAPYRSPTPLRASALRGWMSPKQAGWKRRSAHRLGCEDRRPESPIISPHPAHLPHWRTPLFFGGSTAPPCPGQLPQTQQHRIPRPRTLLFLGGGRRVRCPPG